MTTNMRDSFCSFSWLWLITLVAMLGDTSFAKTSLIAKPGCPTKCGNVTIPYPFGLGEKNECSFSKFHKIYCNTSFNPPKPIIFNYITPIEVIDISIDDGQMRIRNSFVSKCYRGGEPVNSSETSIDIVNIFLRLTPVVLSETANKLIVVGCDAFSIVSPAGTTNDRTARSCITNCSPLDNTKKYKMPCSGTGCCEAAIPRKGMKSYKFHITSTSNINTTSANTGSRITSPYCNTAFVGEENKYNFKGNDLSFTDHARFLKRIMNDVPVVLDWYVTGDFTLKTCENAKKNASVYACKDNTNCTDVYSEYDRLAYRCNCLPGYQGNPYLSPGCTDIDECASPKSNPCIHSNSCKNTIGGYECKCLVGQSGDGLKNGTGCVTNKTVLIRNIIIGTSLGLLVLLASFWWIYRITKRRKLLKTREKFFELNGGLLLIKQLSPNGETSESFNIFSADELETATDKFSEDRILGRGGYGTVYKGILKDGHEVAIKKSKVADQTQIEQFINELVILTQINHRYVVKLLGCCLETEVPLLVYEFISNGTLFDHIHGDKGSISWLNWGNCIRIAAEAADAIAYLHSAASIPIIHRDIKSTNILLNESYTTKISDFGTSKLAPIDQTRGTTIVQGTLGYLDPEYYHTSHLTEKSDVYSFGVVLAELLTKQKPLSTDREPKDTNLATYFTSSVEEDRLMDIVDPQLVKEATEEHLVTMANLITKCLNVMGKYRPTMKELGTKLDELRKQIMHSWPNHKDEEAIAMMGQQQDLYPVTSDCYTGYPSSSECSDNYLI